MIRQSALSKCTTLVYKRKTKKKHHVNHTIPYFRSCEILSRTQYLPPDSNRHRKSLTIMKVVTYPKVDHAEHSVAALSSIWSDL